MSIVMLVLLAALCVSLARGLTARSYRSRLARLERRLGELDEEYLARGEVLWDQTRQIEELRRQLLSRPVPRDGR